MRIIVGNLSAIYSGRGDTELAPYGRIVIYKNDGSVSIHGEKGFKPLNYMTSTGEMIERLSEDQEKQWVFKSKKETLEITFHEIFDEINLDLGSDDPGHSSRSGTEEELQAWLAENITIIQKDLKFIQREYQTGNGPVDILAEGSDGTYYVIEVKRFSTANTVGQVQRYLDGMALKHPERKIVGVIAAVDIKSKTWQLAMEKDITCYVVPGGWADEVKSHKEAAKNNDPMIPLL